MKVASSDFIAGQRYAFASMALVVAILSFVNLAGIEKAILAIVLASKALGRDPAPALEVRRRWATAGRALGAVQILLVAGVVLLNLDRIPKLLEVLRAFADLR